ncbi:MAG: ABC transporter permease subunit [Oscillospiraceae bacterium]|jgi:NitT/TauT family transport system permease protein|nr:ABC transporter permease subunit [Oscillospiraceae bacterium]
MTSDISFNPQGAATLQSDNYPPRSLSFVRNRMLPIIAVLLALLLQTQIPKAPAQPKTLHPYFTYFLLLALALCVVQLTLSFFREKTRRKLAYKGLFVAGVFLFLSLLNILTSKLALLPPLYFPSLDRIVAAIVEDRALLVKCVLYSLRLQLVGYFCGLLAGLITGTLIGFSKSASYWISPLVRVLGPIPSTTWIPLTLIAFPSALSASFFLVALAVWFPTTIMTSSGISNVPQTYFEAGSTLGARRFSHIFRIGLPASMPHIFLGIFNGTCASFITLVTAEMVGARYGIGWYVIWQKDMMSYSNVYGGLIITATLFSILISLLFKLRDKALLWQKDVVKW